MHAETVAAIRSKQTARIILAKEAEMVKQLVYEGFILIIIINFFFFFFCYYVCFFAKFREVFFSNT
jgi:hypothetical protein